MIQNLAVVCIVLLLLFLVAFVAFVLWELWREDHPDEMFPAARRFQAAWRAWRAEPVAPEPVDVSWMAPTGPLPVIAVSAVHGRPALLQPPPLLPAWTRWETPPGGVPVLTGSGTAR